MRPVLVTAAIGVAMALALAGCSTPLQGPPSVTSTPSTSTPAATTLYLVVFGTYKGAVEVDVDGNMHTVHLPWHEKLPVTAGDFTTVSADASDLSHVTAGPQTIRCQIRSSAHGHVWSADIGLAGGGGADCTVTMDENGNPEQGTVQNTLPSDETGGGSGGGVGHIPHIPHPHVHICVGHHVRICS